MTPYLIVFAILSIFAFSDAINVRWKQRLCLLLFSGIILIAFAGLRIDTPDWISYKIGFEEVLENGLNYSKLEVSSLFEPLYNGLVYLTTIFTSDPTIIFLVVAAVAVTLNLTFYKKYSSYFLVVVLLYFVHTFLMRETIQIRAGIAAGIALWALPYALERRFWKFTLLTVLAMGFHLASITVFVIYLAYKLNWSRRTWAIIVGASFVIGIVFPFGKLLSVLPTGGVFDRILVYSWMVGEENAGGVLTNPTIIKQLFFGTIGLIYWDTLKVNFPNFKLLFIPMLCSVCWLMVWNDFAIVAARMGTFLSITEVLVVPILFYIVKPNSKIFIYFAIILYALAILILNFAVKNIMPYQSIFSQ